MSERVLEVASMDRRRLYQWCFGSQLFIGLAVAVFVMFSLALLGLNLAFGRSVEIAAIAKLASFWTSPFLLSGIILYAVQPLGMSRAIEFCIGLIVSCLGLKEVSQYLFHSAYPLGWP